MEKTPRITKHGDTISMPTATFDALLERVLRAESELEQYRGAPQPTEPPPCTICHGLGCPDCKTS